MYQRLVTADASWKRPLVLPAVLAALLGAFLTQIPWQLRHLDAARAYLDPQVKQVFVIVAALVCAALLVYLVVQIAVGPGLLAGVYGQDRSGAVVLASPWGVVGHPRQRIRLVPGEVKVRLAAEPPMLPILRNEFLSVYLLQGGKSLHVLSYVRYGEGSRALLVEWLTQRGITPVFEGDHSVLPG